MLCKKVLFLVLTLVFSLSVLFASEQSWTISTSQGEKELIVPEGMTLEEAYQTMAVMYWEERYDREELQVSLDQLAASAQSYLEDATASRNALNELLLSYQQLASLYEDKTSVPWVKGILGIDFGYRVDNTFDGTLWGGVLIKEKITLEAGLSYPWNFHLKAGIIF